MLQKILKQTKQNPHNLFLIDSLGALVSTLLYVFLLANFEHIFGIPANIIYRLAFLAGIYTIYSALCYFLRPIHWRPYLKIIASANLMHCGLTLALMAFYAQALSLLAWLYFIGELIIVISLAIIELKTAFQKTA